MARRSFGGKVMGDLIMLLIVGGLFWFMVNEQGDQKRQQRKQKLINASRKAYKEAQNG
jgi:preprotein translocase subunit YajC